MIHNDRICDSQVSSERDPPHRLEDEVRTLRRYVILSTLLFSVLLFVAFSTSPSATRFIEIEVERINVVEADGRYALVIANATRLPGPIKRGQEYPAAISGGREMSAGMIFFNHEGTEAGGLVYGSTPTDRGVPAAGSFTFDRINQDQVVQLTYLEGEPGRVFSGLQVWDRPAQPLEEIFGAAVELQAGQITEEEFQQRVGPEIAGTAHRVRLGSAERAAVLEMNDTQGKVRIRMVVDAEDVARLEFLDAEGRVEYRLPER
jgi:hypothetical protein